MPLSSVSERQLTAALGLSGENQPSAEAEVPEASGEGKAKQGVRCLSLGSRTPANGQFSAFRAEISPPKRQPPAKKHLVDLSQVDLSPKTTGSDVNREELKVESSQFSAMAEGLSRTAGPEGTSPRGISRSDHPA